ncbi:MAG: hypothetical protein COA54_10910 [Thiotrichaceae bacterium]|nr:MAG: hypothetical protein COA54_10910 [Thiotrichaceae bacterium]
MDKEKTILLNGASDRSYIFTIYPWQTLLVCSSVIYVVLRQDRFGYSVIYIGSTGMLSGHISDHPLLIEFNEADKTHIGIHIEPSSLMREVKQKDLVMNFMPTLNRDER